MKEHLIGQKNRKTYFIKKAMEAYCDALYQDAQCLDIRKKILSNRALINLWLKNYGKVIEDCFNAISIDKNFISPYIRACEALNGLEKFDKCVKIANKGLTVEPKNKILKDLKKEAEAGLKRLDEIHKKKQEKVNQKKTLIEEKCSEKGIVLGKASSFPLPNVYSVRKISFNYFIERNEGY